MFVGFLAGPIIGAGVLLAQALNRRLKITCYFMAKGDAIGNVDGINIYLQKGHVTDPGFKLDLDCVVSKPDD